MFISKQKRGDKYFWTQHVQVKMRYYNLSPSRVKRVIRYPKRVEEGIAPNTIAVMSPEGGSLEGIQPRQSKRLMSSSKRRSGEIWAMYKIENSKKRIKIITAWRYPGKSPQRNPVPKEILIEIKKFL